MTPRTPVAVLGATGLVGQQLVRMLHRHPWFRLAEVVGSERRSGAPYGETVAWQAGGRVPREAAALRLLPPGAPIVSPVVLSALPAEAARTVEPRLAAEGRRISSNASAFRLDPLVPLLIPEVDADGVAAVDAQPWAAGGGALVTNPNCVVAGLATVLAPLDRAWGVESVTVVTLQALSGAGLAGPGALEMAGNVLPFIDGEEEKIAAETRRLLGGTPVVDVAVTRVPVAHGHMAHVFVRLSRPPGPEAVAELLRRAEPTGVAARLPTVPRRTFRVLDQPDRPQPRLDLGWGQGMGIAVGRIRAVAGHDVALSVLSHNLIRGAAGACLANAELLELHRGLRWRAPTARAGVSDPARPPGPSVPPPSV